MTFFDARTRQLGLRLLLGFCQVSTRISPPKKEKKRVGKDAVVISDF
jgi:hypothetical protein